MAIDPSIALGFRPPEQPSQINMLAQALQLQGLQRQNQMGALDMKDREAAAAERDALRNYLSGGANLDTPEGQSGLYKVAPTQAAPILKGRLELGKLQGEMGKTSADTERIRAQTEGEKFKNRQALITQNLQVLGSVSSPEQAAQWIQGGVQSGLIDMQGATQSLAEMQKAAAEGPQGFARWKAQQQAAGMTIAQQMEQQWKAQDFGLRKDQFGETQRHNKASEGLTARGQNMADARSRESTAAAMTKPFEVTGADGNPILVQQDRQGNIVPVSGYGPKSGSAKPLTDAQAKALLFGTRAQESEKVLNEVGDKYSPAGIATKQALGKAPLIGGALEMGANAALSDKSQQVEQAQRDFINAVLRRESGAVISDSEFANAAKQYFPQPNDSQTVKAQKAKNRSLAINGMLAEVPEGKRASITPNAQTAAPGAPKPGMVQDGWRFKGGNPADPKSWEKQ